MYWLTLSVLCQPFCHLWAVVKRRYKRPLKRHEAKVLSFPLRRKFSKAFIGGEWGNDSPSAFPRFSRVKLLARESQSWATEFRPEGERRDSFWKAQPKKLLHFSLAPTHFVAAHAPKAQLFYCFVCCFLCYYSLCNQELHWLVCLHDLIINKKISSLLVGEMKGISLLKVAAHS